MEKERKNSIKREAIRELLVNSKEHPTAEMIYEKLKPEFPDLSLGTVYRNLAMFCSDGDAEVIRNINGKDRFDGRCDEHAHFVCRKCGRVIDVEVTENVKLGSDVLTKEYGLKPEKFSIIINGICNMCS